MSEHDHLKKQSWFTEKAPGQREPKENLFGDAHVGARTRTQDMVNPNVPVAESAFVKLARAKKAEQQESAGDSAVEHVQRAAMGTGSPLPGDVRGKFESSLGTDLSGVRVHTGAASAAAADAVAAKAYTTGQDIHFAAGQYNPSSKEGQHLLAHETAHTVQQARGAGNGTQYKLDVSEPDDPLEHQADAIADRVVAGQSATDLVGASASRSAGAVQRKEKADQGDQMDEAAQSVKSPLPKAKAGKGKQIAPDQAPTIADVFDPERPALEGASQSTVVAIIQQNVNDLYEYVLFGQLDALKGELSKTAPVPPTPFAMKLLGWVVEQIASYAIGYIGGFLGKELFGHEAPKEATEGAISIGGTEAEPVVSTVTKPAAAGSPPPNPKEKAVESAGEKVGEKAGGLLNEKMLERPTTEASAGEEGPAVTTGNLLDEFIVRERHMLLGKKGDIMARLMIMHEHASGKATADTVKLGEQLGSLIRDPKLTAWFRNKVTMEWLNFMTRVSLGPRREGQTTDLLGANVIGGVADGGVEAQRQWRGADGMIEIMLDVPETVRGTTGVKLHRASIPSSHGATLILQRLTGAGPDGHAYNMATIPVYRRIWLKTGESKLDESPAFVITPDGQVEADVGNTVLAAIGSTKRVPTGNLALDALGVGQRTVHVGETGGASGRITDEERKDPAAWLARGAAFAHCMTGAEMIRQLIATIPPDSIKV